METSAAWQQLFEQWPHSRPRVGIAIIEGQEPISFTDFMLSPGLIVLLRERPDSNGARKVILAFSAISAVKLTDTDDFSELALLGFC